MTPAHSTEGLAARDSQTLAYMHLASALRKNDVALNSPADSAGDLVTELMGQFYKGLRSNEVFANALKRARQPAAAGLDCVSVPLINETRLCCHLLTLSQKQPIPMHDHPNTTALTMVVSGRLRVRVFDLVSCDESAQRVTLKLTRVDQLNEEEAGWVPRGRNNIHSMEALTDQVTLLTVHAPAIEAGTQRYYFPVSAQAELNQEFYARRLFLGSKKHII